MKVHPAAELFPLLGDEALSELTADIRTHGLRHEIVTYQGAVLDGRNRLRACELAGVEPRFEEFHGTDPVAYVVSANLQRRHLNESQRAMLGGRLMPILREEAKKRQADHASTAPGRGKSLPTNSSGVMEPNNNKGEARANAARLANVGSTSVQAAVNVLKDGVPELIAAVDKGQVPVNAAAKIAKESAFKQREAVEKAIAPERPKAAEDDHAPPRHPIHNKTRHLRASEAVEKATWSLEGICIGLASIDVGQIDKSRAAEWAASLRASLRKLSAFVRRMTNEAESEADPASIRTDAVENDFASGGSAPC